MGEWEMERLTMSTSRIAILSSTPAGVTAISQWLSAATPLERERAVVASRRDATRDSGRENTLALLRGACHSSRFAPVVSLRSTTG